LLLKPLKLFSDFDLTEEESKLIWQPVLGFQKLIEFKRTPMYGGSESSVSKLFPGRQNRIIGENFQLTFSCDFDFAEFPFDSHECPVEYGSSTLSYKNVRFNITQAVFGTTSTKSGGDPIILDNLSFPFEFQIMAQPSFKLANERMVSFSYTGIVLKMRRKSPGQLLIGYFYPTASFAFLSMISFMINPDMVSSLC
jgi:hypothetical protein